MDDERRTTIIIPGNDKSGTAGAGSTGSTSDASGASRASEASGSKAGGDSGNVKSSGNPAQDRDSANQQAKGQELLQEEGWEIRGAAVAEGTGAMPKIELIGKRRGTSIPGSGKSSRKTAIILVIAAVLAIAGYLAFRWVMTGVEGQLFELTLVEVDDIDMKKIPDGTYFGGYKAFPIEAEVSVKVSDHKITGIELLKHVNGQGGAAEIITEKVTKANSLQVDMISGATYSSKVILKAIEAALESAL